MAFVFPVVISVLVAAMVPWLVIAYHVVLQHTTAAVCQHAHKGLLTIHKLPLVMHVTVSVLLAMVLHPPIVPFVRINKCKVHLNALLPAHPTHMRLLLAFAPCVTVCAMPVRVLLTFNASIALAILRLATVCVNALLDTLLL